MQRTIITHVGASLLNEQCEVFSTFKKRNDILNDLNFNSDVTIYQPDAADFLGQKLAERWNPRRPGLYEHRHRVSPAEIASLSRLKVGPDDHIALVYTDTDEGAFCAEMLQRALCDPRIPQADYPACTARQVTIHRILGLKVLDLPGAEQSMSATEEFVRVGLPNYVQTIWDLYSELIRRIDHTVSERHGELIFNITAGYKGMIPIARDLGLLLPSLNKDISIQIDTEVCYLYEKSSSMIHYASLPLQFNWRLVNKTLLEQAATADDPATAAQARLPRLDQIDRLERAYFMPLEPGSPYVRLSPLGRVVWALVRQLA